MSTSIDRPRRSRVSPEIKARRAAAVPARALRDGIESVLASSGIPGCSIAVVDRERTCWSDGFGLADVTEGVRATADTVYHLFSGTKLFTATVILQLAERGQLSLDDLVSDHLAEAAHLDGITLGHLLSHRSGLKESLRGLLAARFPYEPPLSAREALQRFPLVAAHAAGARVEYRNTNYALLGAVIEQVTGQGYREAVAARVLRPLGIDATFSSADARSGRRAVGYMRRWDPMRLVLRALYPGVARRLYGVRVGGLVALEDYDLSAAAIGGLVGSMPAFARFVQSQLREGDGVLAARSVRAMQTMVAPGAAGIESRAGVGLGWKFGVADGRTFLNHEGGGAGFTSELRIYPTEGIGIALGMNAMQMPRTMRAAHRICEMVRLAR